MNLRIVTSILVFVSVGFAGANTISSFDDIPSVVPSFDDLPPPGSVGSFGDASIADGIGGLASALGQAKAATVERIAGVMDQKSEVPFLSRKIASIQPAQDCSCCSYYHNAVYGEKYNSDGKYLEKGTKEWCRTKTMGNRTVASQLQKVEGDTYVDLEKAAAIKALNQHMARTPIQNFHIDRKGGRLYRDLIRYQGGKDFEKAVGRLVGYSQGVIEGNQFNSELFKKTWNNYRQVVQLAPKKFLEEPPSVILAYQEFFEAIREEIQKKNM